MYLPKGLPITIHSKSISNKNKNFNISKGTVISSGWYTFCSTKSLPIIFEHLATHYQALETLIDHNATLYPKLNALPLASPNIFYKICLVWAIVNGMPCVTVKFINDIYIPFFLKKMMVTRGNPLQIAQNQANLRENTWQRVLRRVQVMATRFIMV